MKLSQNFTKTTRETLADETSKNAQLLIRAGYVHKAMPGVYAYLPLGLRMLNKIENIVRKNMNSVGGQEILMNNLQPKDWWVKVENRWETLDILFHVPSQTKSEYALSQSNEEQVTTIAKDYIKSYKDLPNGETNTSLAIYQIHTKFRDEIRSKAGLMRGREFRMKDMYDFHATEESQDYFYEKVRQQYSEIYKDLGLDAFCTRASGGSFSKFSHEFQVITDAGEDWLICWSDGIKDNLEIAKGYPLDTNKKSLGEMKLRENLDESIKSAQNHADHAKVGLNRILKTVVYCDSKGQYIGVCIRGDLEINEELLTQLLVDTKHNGLTFKEATPEQMNTIGAERGRTTSIKQIAEKYTKDITWIFDKSIENANGMVASLYEDIDINRDCVTPEAFDFVSVVKIGFARDDNSSVVCEKICRSAEVGNIFKLGKKWTKKESMDLTFADENNQPQYPFMSCYGIGTSRCMGVLAEVYSDEKGLKLPSQVAPFEVHLITHINPKDEVETNERILEIANKIYDGEIKLVKTRSGRSKLLDTSDINQVLEFAKEDSSFSINNLGSNNEILWDDRSGKISIGEKLKDADLIGCPTQIIISKRSLENGGVEIVDRAGGESSVARI
jgi:prolyl-tRNA synthetase